jgi:hypothetical protein
VPKRQAPNRLDRRQPERRKPFILEKKLVVQVRYYEHMYMVSDRYGIRVYTGTDEKLAKTVLGILNGDAAREERRKERNRR